MGPLVLFDLDNTLVDRDGAFRRWAASFVVGMGLPEGSTERIVALDEDGYRPRPEMFATLKSEFALAAGVDELVAGYRATYPRFVTKDERVRVGLSELRVAGWRIVIVTNGPGAQTAKIDAAGLTDLVDACCISELVGVSKPDVRIFEAAARMAGCDLAGWMVGDNPVADIGGGADAGLWTIWLHRGRRWDGPDRPPTRVCGSVVEAIDVLLGVRGSRTELTAASKRPELGCRGPGRPDGYHGDVR